MLSLTGKKIEIIGLEKKLYKKWAGNEMINIFNMAIILIVFKFILSPIYFMSFVVSLFFHLR